MRRIFGLARRKVFDGWLGRVVAGVVAASFVLAWGAERVFAASRTAKVAGQFYPASQRQLFEMVTELISQQPVPQSNRKPRILIVPHAGYPYSGTIAARAFRQLQGQAYDGVVVVGFTHQLPFEGSSVDTTERYETPLGEIPIDQEAVATLLTQPGITHFEGVHESGEHSLEVELPFLQVALQRFRLVPILMGDATLDSARNLAYALARLAHSGDYLFVFSTDLSHFHPYDQAKTIDGRTVNAILFETPQAVYRLFIGGEVEACGRAPILTSLFLSKELGYLKPELLAYANSGDAIGDRSRVVGYAAVAMSEQQSSVTRDRLSAQAGSALVSAARQALEHLIGDGTMQHAAEVSLEQYPELSQPHGIFVTLRKQGALRGCIGRIEADESLASIISETTVDAALHDPRFSPVTHQEIPDINIEISVLTAPRRVGSQDEVVAGRDGVVLEYQGRRGVFLPQVWEETGWTRLEFLRELASQKAGMPRESWREAMLYVFQAQSFEEPLPARSATAQ